MQVADLSLGLRDVSELYNDYAQPHKVRNRQRECCCLDICLECWAVLSEKGMGLAKCTFRVSLRGLACPPSALCESEKAGILWK